ncbi:WlaTC/HtrL family glycosyltransferase [Helicobacter sp. 23-1045]
MNAKMTIITAYYQLDLAKTSAQSYKAKRTTADYLAFFGFWAGVKNDIVIYTDLDIEDEIYAMRSARNGGKTQIIKKSLLDFAIDDYEAIKGTFARFNQTQGRFDPTHPPHTSADYDYLMYCKSFFVCDFVRNHAESRDGVFLWLDFGYNFNGFYFTDSTQFDFELAPDSAICATLAEDKIHLFSLGAIDSHTMPHILTHGTEHFLIGNVMGGGGMRG